MFGMCLGCVFIAEFEATWMAWVSGQVLNLL